ncbi:hypothetical protein, partial [Bartonella sp. CL63NXGY]|uniref:hypothetical protein n=1 Tax=Bartonella sp. CL63NXGY TaxID=3243538 RepID=UPI0035D0848D
TGTSDTAGHCLVCTGTYRGHQIITVVLHATGDGKDSAFVQTKRMLIMLKEEGHLRRVKIPAASLKLKVAHGAPRKVTLTPRTVTIWEKDDDADYDLGVQTSKITAPVKAGQHVGNVRITGSDIQTINNEPLVFPLYTSKTVVRSHWLW